MSLSVSEGYDALIEAGTSEAQATADAIPLAEHLATKDAIGAVRTEIAELQAGLPGRHCRQLWLMAAGIVDLTVT